MSGTSVKLVPLSMLSIQSRPEQRNRAEVTEWRPKDGECNVRQPVKISGVMPRTRMPMRSPGLAACLPFLHGEGLCRCQKGEPMRETQTQEHRGARRAE